MKLIHAACAAALALTSSGALLAAQDAKPAMKASEPTYRVTYTLTELDGAKRIGVQHFALTINPASPRGTMKFGSKIPVITGSYNPSGSGAGAQTQFTYLDIGLNLDATLTPMEGGVLVASKVEQSSVADPATIQPQSPEMRGEPVIRQAVLTNTALLTPGKPVVLGSLDTPGSTRHLDIEIVLDLVK